MHNYLFVVGTCGTFDNIRPFLKDLGIEIRTISKLQIIIYNFKSTDNQSIDAA